MLECAAEHVSESVVPHVGAGSINRTLFHCVAKNRLAQGSKDVSNIRESYLVGNKSKAYIVASNPLNLRFSCMDDDR
jgi:hypothetical protein